MTLLDELEKAFSTIFETTGSDDYLIYMNNKLKPILTEANHLVENNKIPGLPRCMDLEKLEIDGNPIIFLPSDRMRTKSENSEVNFIIAAPDAIKAITKIEKIKYIRREDNLTKDADICIISVFNNTTISKTDAKEIYVSVKE